MTSGTITDPKLKQEAMDALASGMTPKQVSISLNIPVGTIYTWRKRQKNGRPSNQAPKLMPVVHEVFNSPPKMSLEEFAHMISGLAIEYQRLKDELARQKKLSEAWQKRTGDALQQAQNALQQINK